MQIFRSNFSDVYLIKGNPKIIADKCKKHQRRNKEAKIGHDVAPLILWTMEIAEQCSAAQTINWFLLLSHINIVNITRQFLASYNYDSEKRSFSLYTIFF